MHMAGDFELAGDFESPGQDTHMLDPIETENVFGGQPSHLPVSAFKNVPGLQTSACATIGVHEAAPKPLVDPAMHTAHVAEPTAPTVAENVRGGHGKQSLEPAAVAKYPTSHWKLLGFAMQADDTVDPLSDTSPSAHFVQPSRMLLFPSADPYVPGGQNSHRLLERS